VSGKTDALLVAPDTWNPAPDTLLFSASLRLGGEADEDYWRATMRAHGYGLILMVLVAGLAGAAQAASQGGPSEVHEITMTAKNYGFDPSVITVKKGEKLRLIITATDCDHEFKLDAFRIDQVLKKGDPTTIEFSADKVGTFEFKSSVYCGRGHGKMKGKLIVEE
jgi:cytochrome c oxidase subunit 2